MRHCTSPWCNDTLHVSSLRCNETFYVSSRDVPRLFITPSTSPHHTFHVSLSHLPRLLYAQVPDMRRHVLPRQKRWYGLETHTTMVLRRTGVVLRRMAKSTGTGRLLRKLLSSTQHKRLEPLARSPPSLVPLRITGNPH